MTFWDYFTDEEREAVSALGPPLSREEADQRRAEIIAMSWQELLRFAKIMIGEVHAERVWDLQPDIARSMTAQDVNLAITWQDIVNTELGRRLLEQEGQTGDSAKRGRDFVETTHAELIQSSADERDIWRRADWAELHRRGVISQERFEELEALKTLVFIREKAIRVIVRRFFFRRDWQ